MKRPMSGVLLSMLFVVSGWSIGTAQSLEQTTNRTTVDGVIERGEYSYTRRETGMTLYANWRGESLYLALQADTGGWVAIGINARIMDGAHIMIGFSDDGRTVFKEQVGSGHGHRDTGKELVRDHAVTESSGRTSMEVELRAVDVLAGSDSLEVIAGYGERDSLSMYHGKNRSGFSIPVNR